MCYFIKKYARGRPNELAHGTIKTEYARAPRRLRVWQRLFLALGFGFVLMLLGTAVVDFDRRPADTAAAGGSGWAEPVYGYVLAGEGEVDVRLYTEGLGPMTECGRGVTVELESWEPFIADDGSEYYHVWYGGRYGYIAVDNIAASPERVLRESQVYVRTATNLLASPDDLALTDYVEKGTALNVLSYDYLEDDGSRDELVGMNPRKIREKGVSLSFVPEDRLGMGLVANMDLTDNMMLRSFRSGHSLFTDRKRPKKLAQKVVDELEVVTPSVSTPVRRLSGGNVQKVLVGREIASAPTVLLTAYAVRGLDINSSYAIYDLVTKQKERGVAVVFVGEDLDVLLELCDRILVLCGGKVSGVVEHPTPADKNRVGLMMTKVGG